MSAELEADGTAGGSVLDNLFGTAAKGLDLWSKWTSGKTDNLTKKAALPTTATQPNLTAGAIDPKKLALYGGGILAAVVVLVLLLRPRSAK